MERSRKREIAERYVAAYNAHDIDAMLALYAEGGTMEDPVGSPVAEGREAIAARYREGFEMGVTIELDGAIRCAGESVAFPLRTATEPRIFIIDVFDLDSDGRIQRMRAYWSSET